MQKPNFNRINRYSVQINSLKNQLRTASDINELISVSSKIIELEKQIILERMAGFNALQKEKNAAVEKIDKIRRSLEKEEEKLWRINTTIDNRTTQYRNTLQSRIEELEHEFEEHSSTMENTKQ